MKKYICPEIDIIELRLCDVITTSDIAQGNQNDEAESNEEILNDASVTTTTASETTPTEETTTASETTPDEETTTVSETTPTDETTTTTEEVSTEPDGDPYEQGDNIVENPFG